MVLVEGALGAVGLTVAREPFDRGNAGTVGPVRQRRTALHRGAVEVDRAGATVPRVAADVRSCEPEIVPDRWTRRRRAGTSYSIASPFTSERDRAAG